MNADPLANYQPDPYSTGWINNLPASTVAPEVMPVTQTEPAEPVSGFSASTSALSEKVYRVEPSPAVPVPAKSFYSIEPLAPVQTAAERLKQSEINFETDIQKPPVCLFIDEQSVFYLGDISTTIGKAKGRKTFATGLFLAAVAGSCTIQDRIRGDLPEGKRTVLLFDTEQGSYHAQKAAKRVLRLLNSPFIDNFKAYGLRPFTPAERLEIIEHAIYNTPNLGFVCIDGIRDLVTSINDEEQATMITSKLLKWSEELQIHINCILHMNKGDNNARGHVGTELMNKSLTVLGVTKNEKMGDYSTIEPIACRDKEPAQISFGISENTGLPYLLDQLQVEQLQKVSERKGKKITTPADYLEDVHTDNLKLKIFYNEPLRKYSELVSCIKNTYAVGDNKAKDFLTYFVDKGFIRKVPKGSLSVYELSV